MQCNQIREHLSAYLDKELTAELSAAVRAHLAECPDCRALLDELRATVDLLGRLPAHEAPASLADEVRQELEEQTLLQTTPEPARRGRLEEQPQERTLALHRARLWPRALAAAAVLLIALGIGLFAYLGRPSQSPLSSEVGYCPFIPQPEPTHAKALRSDAADKEAPPATPAPATVAAKPETSILRGGAAETQRGLVATPPAEPAAAPIAPAPIAAPAAIAAVETKPDTSILRGGAAETRLDLATPPAEPLPPNAAVEAVQQTMNSVAAGEADMPSLRRLATSETLRQATNQVSLRAASPDAADRELQNLFAANGWLPLAMAEAKPSLAMEKAAEETGGEKTATEPACPVGRSAETPEAGPGTTTRRAVAARKAEPPATGVYFLAHEDGEQWWVILADRDSLSRFAGQLAQSGRWTVSADSTPALQTLRQAQTERREFAGAAKRGESPAETQAPAQTGLQDLRPADKLRRLGTASTPRPDGRQVITLPETQNLLVIRIQPAESDAAARVEPSAPPEAPAEKPAAE